jgi:hypothetical protein
MSKKHVVDGATRFHARVFVLFRNHASLPIPQTACIHRLHMASTEGLQRIEAECTKFGFSAHAFTNVRGNNIAYYKRIPATAPKAVVVLCHGYAHYAMYEACA